MTDRDVVVRGSGGENEFDRLLAALKATGCNLLVTGEVARDVTLHASQRFLGSVIADRERILVQTDLRVGPDHELRSAFGERARVVEQDLGTPMRSAAATGTADERTPIVDTRLQPLQNRICEEIADLDELEADLDPAQLRLNFLTLRPIVEEFTYHDSSRFIRVVGNAVKGVSGMAYYHFPVPDTDPRVATYGELFDARIELRQRNGLPPEHRWHVPDGGYTSPWTRI